MAERRFEFGKNWSSFLELVDEARIATAEKSLLEGLDVRRLDGRSFLDVGSGSGLFSLAARRLGARVFSFDFDPTAVGCARELKRRYFEGDPEWQIEEGSVLDAEFLASLGRFDIVYAYGTLHHTGDMWTAIELTADRVVDGGVLYLMIYLDQGWKSVVWRAVKRTYCSGRIGRTAVLTVFFPYFAVRGLIRDLVRLKSPFAAYRDYGKRRGMSWFHDWIDWLGGYPYEFAAPGAVTGFIERRGFTLRKMRGSEYVLYRMPRRDADSDRTTEPGFVPVP